MAFLLTALVRLALIAGAVTIVDAVRASHWRVVAVERRQSWHERTADDAEPPDGAEPLSSARG
jgi:hypothetical protein